MPAKTTQQKKWFDSQFSFWHGSPMTLDQFRKTGDMTYKALADLLALDVGHARRLCLGQVKPTLDTIRKIEKETRMAVNVSDWS